MRKKSLKKLMIAEDTLRELSASQLVKPAGEVTFRSSCDYCSVTACPLVILRPMSPP